MTKQVESFVSPKEDREHSIALLPESFAIITFFFFKSNGINSPKERCRVFSLGK
jgi:hypothetical protein